MLESQLLYRCMCAMAGMFPRLLDRKIDAIFVWGRAADEWQSTRFDDGVLKLAADLYRLTGSPVVIPGYVGSEKGQGTTGYPGPVAWRDALEILGVADVDVFPTAGRGFNTKSEMDDFIDLAIDSQWLMTVAVTQYPHALRAMLGTVKSLADRGTAELVVAPVWPHQFDWSRECYGSQGEGPYSRLQWIDQEFERIPRYQEKGDLATLDQLFRYLADIHQQLRGVG
ncbi:MAG: hypothetical protein WEA04_02595 [Candidatus Andersenbacteria bacterium]